MRLSVLTCRGTFDPLGGRPFDPCELGPMELSDTESEDDSDDEEPAAGSESEGSSSSAPSFDTLSEVDPESGDESAEPQPVPTIGGWLSDTGSLTLYDLTNPGGTPGLKGPVSFEIHDGAHAPGLPSPFL